MVICSKRYKRGYKSRPTIVQDQLEQFYFTQKQQASSPVEKTEVLTLTDIEKLIDAKLKTLDQVPKPSAESALPPMTYRLRLPREGLVRRVSDISIEQINDQIVPQGYMVVRK